MLSVPEYALADKSVPETVAVVEVIVVETVQEYVQTEAEVVALIDASEVIPEKDIVGVSVIASEKAAVMVTTFELETILSESLSVKVTEGKVLSILKVILFVPE